MKPLDVLEWLSALALTDDFAREALEIVTDADLIEAYWEIRADLEKVAEKEFAEDFRLVEFFVDRNNLLGELSDTLDKAGFKGDPGDALDNLLAELEELRTENAALKAPDNLEYDL